jgi:hypothetical protein
MAVQNSIMPHISTRHIKNEIVTVWDGEFIPTYIVFGKDIRDGFLIYLFSPSSQHMTQDTSGARNRLIIKVL